ncbi:MAG TPA: ABC transporter family substrate-binding protein [Acidimicrobiales bacterium]|nr:ABC transporter family substrate-binding protein [Acidimicrobiales bacterium]
MSSDGAEPGGRRGRIQVFWAERRARWTLPLLIIVIIVIVAIVDHLGSHRIREVTQQSISDLVSGTGGTATVSLDQPWDGFNPDTPGGANSSTPTLLSSVLPSAYTILPNLTTTLNSNLLTSTKVTSVSPLTIQYVLNPAAVWSDGVPVSAEDFIYAWKAQRGTELDVNGQPEAAASTLGYRDVASVTGSQDGKTVTVVFTQPFTDWRTLFSGMVPAHIAERVGWNHGFDTFNPAVDLSAGPYLLHSVSAGTAVLVRNPRWWGSPGTLASVTVASMSNPSTWVAQLGSSNHMVAQPASFNLATLNATSSLPNTQSSVQPSLTFMQVEFNTISPLGSQMALRQGVAHSIDREALLAQTFKAVAPDLEVNEDHLAVPFANTYAKSSAASGYDKADPAAADRLLTSVGYHRAPDLRYVDAGGNQLTVRMAVESGDPWIAQVGEAIASQLRVAGIAVVIIPVDGQAGLAATAKANGYDLALVTRSAGPYLTTTDGWYSEDLGPPGAGGSTDWSNFDDPAVDQLFAEASQELNPTVGDPIYAQIDDTLWGQMVSLPLFQEPALVANGVQLDGIQYNSSIDGLLWNLPSWSPLIPKPTGSP